MEFFKTFNVAGTGPIPIYAGSTPALAPAITLAIGFKLYEGGFFGYTFLGARYPFIFDNPTVAALQFGIFLLYLNFRFTIAKNTFDKSKFLIISIGVFYLSLYTGGRAGIIISSLSLLVTILLYFFPKKRFIFNTPKSIKTKLFIMSILFTLSVGFLVLSSNKTFSGRLQTQTNISQEGLITGVYGSRLNIISQIKNERKFKDLLIGKPGLGTNTACNAVTSGIDAKECRKTDSLPATSLLSFGLIGVIFFIATFFAILNNSYSPLVPITFIIYSLSQIPPELIYIWTQMVIIVLLSRQHSKFIALQGI